MNVIILALLFMKKQQGIVFVLSCFSCNLYFILRNVFCKFVEIYIVEDVFDVFSL